MSIPVSRSPRRYLERAGIVPTTRGPSPRLCLAANAATRYGLSPPMLNPFLLGITVPANSPDRVPSTVWPYGVDGESPQ